MTGHEHPSLMEEEGHSILLYSTRVIYLNLVHSMKSERLTFCSDQ